MSGTTSFGIVKAEATDGFKVSFKSGLITEGISVILKPF